MISYAIALCGPVERCLVIARWRVSVGWCQRVFKTSNTKGPVCHCALGAMGWSHYGRIDHAAEEAARFMYDEVLRCQPIQVWNDAPGRTQAEVIAAFDRAILLARARGA